MFMHGLPQAQNMENVESYNPSDELSRLERELQENEKQERKLVGALIGNKKQLKEVRNAHEKLQEQLDDLELSNSEKILRKLHTLFGLERAKLEEELNKIEKQEQKLISALRGIGKQLRQVKDARNTLQEQQEYATNQIEIQERNLIDAQTDRSEQLQEELNTKLLEIELTNQDKCNGVLKSVLPMVVENMLQANSLFRRMYKCPVYTGSYYEKLRIKDAGEFDINLVLDLPIEAEFIEISPRNPPSYTTLRLQKDVTTLNLDEVEEKELRFLLDDNLFVLPGQLLRWFQSVVDLARLSDLVVEGVKQIKYTSSGPARTLNIYLDDIEETFMSIDLVPVFRFHFQNWPEHMKCFRKDIVDETIKEHRQLYLVPKIYKPGTRQIPQEPAQRDIPLLWRMHFADIEKSVLKGYDVARSVIKLLKLLRDSQKWSNLHSYYLKTLVLNDIADNPRKDWDQCIPAERLLEMMDKLRQCLDRKFLPHFFFQNVNLFQYMGETEMDNMSRRLNKVMDIADEPTLVKEYFKVDKSIPIITSIVNFFTNQLPIYCWNVLRNMFQMK